MSNQEKFATEIHKKVVKKFLRRKVIVHRIDEIWAIDIASMDAFVEYNRGYKYILCLIDVFSKYAWCVPLKTKNAPTVLQAVKTVVDESKREPERIWVDKGSEFYNKEFLAWTKNENITIYSTYGESKSVVVERFIRTLKELIMKKFTATNSYDWVKLLPEILEFYNHRYHKTIKMSPKEASDPDNEGVVYLTAFLGKEKTKATKKQRLHVGDFVRVSRTKETFEKGYRPNWSYEVFEVSKVLDTDPVTYELIDYDKEAIQGSFYEQELQKTETPDYYEVEKILDTRTQGSKKEYLVKFYGWANKFNMWLTEDQVQDITGSPKDFLADRKRDTSQFWKDVISKLK